jgi:hypothetical protein
MTLKSFDIVLVALLILLLAIRLIIAYHTSIDECPLGYEEWFVRPPLLVIPFQVKIGNSKLFGHFKRIPVVRRLLHLISGKRKIFGKKCEKVEKLYRNREQDPVVLKKMQRMALVMYIFPQKLLGISSQITEQSQAHFATRVAIDWREFRDQIGTRRLRPQTLGSVFGCAMPLMGRDRNSAESFGLGLEYWILGLSWLSIPTMDHEIMHAFQESSCRLLSLATAAEDGRRRPAAWAFIEVSAHCIGSPWLFAPFFFILLAIICQFHFSYL